MKSILTRSALVLALAGSLVSCQTQAENDRLARVADLALSYAASRGAITPADAAAIREAGKVILKQDGQPEGPAAPVTATK